MKQPTLKEHTAPTAIESTKFRDEMIVDAADLDTAMRYPIEFLQPLIRAYFGCGIVCGLEVSFPHDKPGWTIKIGTGTALDCYGNPLHLCKPVSFDIRTDPCSCDEYPDEVCVAIRRETIDDGCCGSNDTTISTRVKEMIKIKVFDAEDPPDTICMKPKPAAPEDCDPNAERPFSLCDCLKTCPDDKCCGDAWVLLACLPLNECGATEIGEIQRKYVKPIECLCRYEKKNDDWQSVHEQSHTEPDPKDV